MKKICECNAIEFYNRTGEMPWTHQKKYRLKKHCIEILFSPAQKQFLEKHSYTARPHPKHSPTIELFVDEQKFTDQDWTVVRLLF